MPAGPVYLDFNASAPMLPQVRAAMIDAFDRDANPSSVHSAGRAAKAMVAAARREVAALVNTKPEHVVFTSGATEAAMMALTPDYSLGRSPVKMGHLYVCAADHPCMTAGGRFPADRVTKFPVLSSGLVDLDALAALLAAHDRTNGLPLVAVHIVNNETGVIQPIEEIATVVKGAGGTLVADAVQAAGRIALDLSAGHADYMILSSHKIGGPKGAGALVGASDLMMPMPLIRGGGQERGHRGGTEAPILLAGFGVAARIARDGLDDYAALANLRDGFEIALRNLVPDVMIHGASVQRVANTSYFTIPGRKAETLQIALDLAGIAVSAGSACSSGKVGRSHVLTAMGIDNDEGAVRVSLGPASTQADVDNLLEALGNILARNA